MDNQLCQALRSLCFNTDWNYAIFWKLSHQPPMVLTLEDAYYNLEHHGPSENESSDKAGRSCSGQLLNHSLGLALAKLSGHVYSLGEGVVGQVATTNKHLWISSDKYATDVCSSLKYYDGWLTQLSAGIKTIAVVAVFPHGVVQLGSFKTISEDLNLVNHIRDTMAELHENIPGYNRSMECSPCLFNESCRSSVSRNYCGRLRTPYRYLKNEETKILSSVYCSLDELDFIVPLPEGCARMTEVTNMNQEPEKSISGVCESVDQLESHLAKSLQQRHENLASKKGENSSGFWDSVVGTKKKDDPSSLSNYIWEDSWYLPAMFHDHSQTSGQTEMSLAAREPPKNVKMDYKRAFEFHRESNHIKKWDPCLNFSAGCELHEALGPNTKKRKTEIVVQIPDETTCNSYNLVTLNSCTEYLLEAVVAEACKKTTEVKHEDTISGSVKSLSTVDKVFEPPTIDTHGISSVDYSSQQSFIVEESANYYIPTSGARHGRYPKGLSSASYSECDEKMERPEELHTISRKASYGEKCRRRPRDRQLIQDRIKELRELVPNGSKCSIDSLLERTIKHMLFMQCTTEQADKLDICAESKLVGQEIVTCRSSSNEQGSSWAMEVGNHLRVLPVTVENIDTSGQMLIKMLCEDCSPFLEITKTIRSLGLTILKGSTDVYDGKILIHYLVEGENNRNMHRADVLCSLLQILQQKAHV